MPLSRIAGFGVAAMIAVAPAAIAQTTQSQSQTQTQPQTQTTQEMQAATPQTFTGCLMKESDYRAAHNLGSGALGGVGLGDEYVLVDVKISKASSTAVSDVSGAATARTGSSSVTASGSAATTGSTTSATGSVSMTTSSSPSASVCNDRGNAYRLTGSDEEQLRDLVGKHVAVLGRFKDPAAAAAPRPGELPAEVEIVSFRAAPSPDADVAASAAVTTPPVTDPARTTSVDRSAASTTAANDRTAAVSTTGAQTSTSARTTSATADVSAQTDMTASERRQLPNTASPTALIGLIGLFSAGSGIALMTVRRRR